MQELQSSVMGPPTTASASLDSLSAFTGRIWTSRKSATPLSQEVCQQAGTHRNIGFALSSATSWRLFYGGLSSTAGSLQVSSFIELLADAQG